MSLFVLLLICMAGYALGLGISLALGLWLIRKLR